MHQVGQQPIGPGRRRLRLSDTETERRMLDAALRLIGERGMSVSLEHLGLEDVIRAAGVSRTSAYRRWPYKDLFLSDLLLELARGNELGGVDPQLAWAAADLVMERVSELRTPSGRRDVAVELLRTTFEADVEAICASAQFRTYIGLRATFVGLPDGDLQREVGAALARTERRFTSARAEVLADVAAFLGFRLAPPLTGPEGFELVARAVGAVTTGMVVAALADPGLLTERRTLQAFGTSRPAQWSTPAYVTAGIVVSYVEADSDADWDDTRTRGAAWVLRSRFVGLATQAQAGADLAPTAGP